MVQVPVCWRGEFQCAEADVIESFVVDTERFISIFNELMDRQGSVVWLYNCVRNLKIY